MATTFWSPNGQAIAQVATLQVTAVSVGGTLTATINSKNITYTCVTGDTLATAATAWFALLTASDVPPEFGRIDWTNPSDGVILGTAGTPGTPFVLTKSQAGGATCTQTATTANSSPSDVNNANNWLRSGSASLPQNGDDVILANSDVPLLWNLDALASVQFNSFNRYQSFTGTIGLPDVNPDGYIEYLPTYFQFRGPGAGTLNVVLGVGEGGGPSRERYNVGTQLTAWTVIASGSPSDAQAIRILNVNASSTLKVLGSSVGVAFWPGEVTTLASAMVDGGGSLTLGPGVTMAGTFTVTNGVAFVYCGVGAIDASNGSQVTVIAQGSQVSGVVATYAAVSATGGSRISWLSNATITALTLTTGGVLDKSLDARSMIITDATIDGDSCQVIDPLSTITWTNAASVKNLVSSGPFTFLGTRTVKIT